MSASPSPRFQDADFEEIGDQRRADRRKGDRRAVPLRLDPMFAATLVNHIAAPETTITRGYTPRSRLRPGIAFDIRA